MPIWYSTLRTINPNPNCEHTGRTSSTSPTGQDTQESDLTSERNSSPPLHNLIAGGLIRFYQLFISPLLGGSCRYYPSCSEYARESFSRYSFIKALYRSAWRILRCNPFSRGGVDLP